MTRYHLYIAAGSVIDETTRVYRVAIGTTKQANRDYLALQAHAVNHNHYFHIIDQKTQEFMYKVCHSVSGHTLLPVTISARELRKSFATATDNPPSHGTLRNQHRMRLTLNLSYRVSSGIALRK